jgi:hypothetical protein
MSVITGLAAESVMAADNHKGGRPFIRRRALGGLAAGFCGLPEGGILILVGTTILYEHLSGAAS